MKTHIIRFGGLIPTYYPNTCHHSEAKEFTKEEAERLATELQAKHTCGVRAIEKPKGY